MDSKKRKLISRTWLLVVALSVASCESDSVSIVGTWEYQDSGNGPFAFDHSAFLTDGRKCVITYFFENTDLEIVAFLNTWRIENGVIITTYGPNTSPYTSEGYVMRDRIKKLDSDYLAVVMDEQPPSDVVDKFVRLDTDPERVCELASAIVENGGVNL